LGVWIELETLKNKPGKLCAWRDQPEYGWVAVFIESVTQSNKADEPQQGTLIGIVMDSKQNSQKAHQMSFGRSDEFGSLEMEMGFERVNFPNPGIFMKLTYGLKGGGGLAEIMRGTRGNLPFSHPRIVSVPEGQYLAVKKLLGYRKV